MCNVKIVDPSNTDLENLCGPEGFQTNCFTKRYEQWLPRPTIGEILILRDVKVRYRICPGPSYSARPADFHIPRKYNRYRLL